MKALLEYLQKGHITIKNNSPYYIEQDRSQGAKYEFSSDELEELMQYIEQDEDFIDLYKDCANPKYHSMQDAVLDFERFLNEDVYLDINPKKAHKFLISDHEGVFSYIVLTTGKIVNTDNLYTEFKNYINNY